MRFTHALQALILSLGGLAIAQETGPDSRPYVYIKREAEPTQAWLEGGRLHRLRGGFEKEDPTARPADGVPMAPTRLGRSNEQGAGEDPWQTPRLGREHAPLGGLWGQYHRRLPWGEDVPPEKRKGVIPPSEFTFVPFDAKSGRWETENASHLRWPSYFTCYMLSEERVLGLAPDVRTFRLDGQSFPAAIFRRNTKGQFQLERGEDLGIEGLPLNGSAGSWPQAFLEEFWVEARAAWCGEHLVLAAPHGAIWTFDANGKRRGPQLPPGFSGLGNLPKPLRPWTGTLLGLQARPDGTLLLSLVDPETVARIHRMLQDKDALPPHPMGRPTPEFITQHDQAQAFFFRKLFEWPLSVRWYEFTPAEAKCTEIAAPPGIPTILNSEAELSSFTWRLNQAGSVEGNLPVKAPSTPAKGRTNQPGNQKKGGSAAIDPHPQAAPKLPHSAKPTL